jgi:hypothetical protein
VGIDVTVTLGVKVYSSSPSSSSVTSISGVDAEVESGIKRDPTNKNEQQANKITNKNTKFLFVSIFFISLYLLSGLNIYFQLYSHLWLSK